MNASSNLEMLSRILTSQMSRGSSCSRPRTPETLHTLCLRQAAIYATTALYEYHTKIQESQTNARRGVGGMSRDDPLWEAVFPLLDAHFLQLVPNNLYEEFLDYVLSTLEFVCHYDAIGKSLMQYIILFFPRNMKRFKISRRYKDRVMMPTICCLYRSTNIEELYLENADSAAISNYLLAHVFKFLNNLRVVTLPKQTDDDVISAIGINCQKLASIILTGTSVTNSGLSWLLCCRKLHTVIMQGYFQNVSAKGVALLINGLPHVKHVVYDMMTDVLTFVDFSAGDAISPKFGLNSIIFNNLELVGSNHLELVTKLMPEVQWLSVDSALYYSLEGMGKFKNLTLFRINYKSRAVDSTVLNFFQLNGSNLRSLHLVEVKDLTLENLRQTVGKCQKLENLVLVRCSFKFPLLLKKNQTTFIPKALDHIQLFGCEVDDGSKLLQFLALFKNLKVIDMDRCCLNMSGVEQLIETHQTLQTLRCDLWPFLSECQLMRIQGNLDKKKDRKHRFVFNEPRPPTDQTRAARLLSEYAGISPVILHHHEL